MTAPHSGNFPEAIFLERSTWLTPVNLTPSDKGGATPDSSDSYDVFNDLNSMLWLLAPPVLIVFGTFGNVMTVVVMRGMRGSESTTSLSQYFIALAVSDQFQLLSAVVFLWVKRRFHWPAPFFRYNLLCILPKFTWNMTGTTSAWFLVAMTYQRVTSVIAPHRVGVLCTARRGKFIIAIVVFIACALHIQYMFTWTYWPEFGDCEYRPEARKFTPIFEWLDLFFFSIIPFVLLSSGNSVLVWQVVKSLKLSRSMRGVAEKQATSESERVNSMTITLIVTSTTFLALTLPICIMDVTLQVVFHSTISPLMKFVKNIGGMLWMSSCAYNFYLYILTGRKFREEAKRYLCCHRRDDVK